MAPATERDATLQGAIRAFLREQEGLERSQHTLRNYAFTFRGFARSAPKSLADITADDVSDYLISLRRAGKASGTVALHYRHLRAFFNWCEAKELVERTPMRRMRSPRQEHPVIAPYADDEIRRLLAVDPEKGPPGVAGWRAAGALRLRNQALICVLASTGIRKGEAANLRRQDIQEDALLIRGKGNRERLVPLDDHTRGLLNRWLAHHSEASVFGLKPHSIYSVIYRAAIRAGVLGAFVHRFRDTFAIRYLERGGSIDNLQTLLGHANINMTLRYVQHGRQERALAEARQLTPLTLNALTIGEAAS